jgi:GNAT superfamily N-acetyltransferase
MNEQIRRLEEITLNSSSALQQRFYDGWVLRFSPGSEVKRANSVSALYPSILEPTVKIDYCERTYAQAGLPIRFRLNAASIPQELDLLLERRGYRKIEPTLVMRLVLDEHPPRSVAAGFTPRRIDDWISISSALRGTPRETLQARAQRLASAAVNWEPVTLDIDQQTVSSGIGAGEDEYFGLFDLFTPEASRNRGYSTALVYGLLESARRNGARYAYLQVDEANAPARRIYERVGFQPIYSYWYRVAP